MKKLNVGASSARPHFEEITKKSPLPPRGTVSGADWGFSNKGITLIALIITIIIMLILAAVTIDIVVDGKLFDKAQEAVDKTNDKVGATQDRIDELMGKLDENQEASDEETTECVHTYGEWEVTTAATCVATGIQTKTCTKCGTTVEEELAMDTVNGHSYSVATCVELAICSRCNGTTGELAEHNYVDGTCSICGSIILITFSINGVRLFFSTFWLYMG